jgi:uncharacterized membrane-anchored protein
VGHTFSLTCCVASILLSFTCNASNLSEAEIEKLYGSMNPIYGPSTVDILGKATARIDSDRWYLDVADTKKYFRLTENLVPEAEVVLILDSGNNGWAAYFSLLDTGYIKDLEPPDSDATLEEAKDNNIAANVYRQEQDLPLLYVDRWAIEPRYDPNANLLEWAMVLTSTSSDVAQSEVINYHTRILGREVTMQVVLVCSSDVLESSIVELKETLRAYNFNAGQRYADFKEGDRVAQYGLAALITGGAAALATKKGFWAAAAAFLIAAKKFLFVLLMVALVKIGSIIRWVKSLFTSH